MNQTTESLRKTRPLRRRALLVSIVLNLFLSAVIGGHLLRSHYARPVSGESTLANALANAQAVLSSSDAAAFGAVFRRDAPNYVGAAAELEQARSELDRKIVDDPFDPRAVAAALKTWQISRSHFLDAIGPTLIDALAKVSADGRTKLVAERRQEDPPLHAQLPAGPARGGE